MWQSQTTLLQFHMEQFPPEAVERGRDSYATHSRSLESMQKAPSVIAPGKQNLRLLKGQSHVLSESLRLWLQYTQVMSACCAAFRLITPVTSNIRVWVVLCFCKHPGSFLHSGQACHLQSASEPKATGANGAPSCCVLLPQAGGTGS